MKQWLAIVFLTIFSFQLLPVKEIGKLLFKGQTTEEIHSDVDNGGGGKMKQGDADPFMLFTQSFANETQITAQVMVAMHKSDNVPVSHVTDIFTPPPNRA